MPARSNSLDHLVTFVALGAVVGGFVEGLSGFAFGLTAMAVWAWSIEPVLAGPLVAFGTLFGQILSIGTVRRGLDAGLIWPLVVGGVLGVPLGVALLPHLDPLAFKLSVGALLLVWCPTMLMAREISRISGGGRLADGLVGWIGGIMCGIAGLNGPAPTLWTTLRGWDDRRLSRHRNHPTWYPMAVRSGSPGDADTHTDRRPALPEFHRYGLPARRARFTRPVRRDSGLDLSSRFLSPRSCRKHR